MIKLTHDTSFKFYQAAEATSILNHLINSENITSSSSCGRQTRWHTPPSSSVSLFQQGGMSSCQFAPLHYKQAGVWTCRTNVPKLHVSALIQNDWRRKTLLHRAGFNPTVPISYLEFPLLSHEFYSVAVLEAPSPPQETLDLTFGESNPILAVLANHQTSNSNTSCLNTQRCNCCFRNQNKFHYFSFN